MSAMIARRVGGLSRRLGQRNGHAVTTGQQLARPSWAEPWKIKSVEMIKMTSKDERAAALAAAGLNTFLLRSEDVYIDLLTDSGTSAMSDYQWAGMMLGDEAYAGSRNFFNLERAVAEHYGYKHLIPTHQGRGAEHILSKITTSPGDVVPGNMYFTTTRLHQELSGGTFVDVIVDEAHDPTNLNPFKGNVDLTKLERVLKGKARVPYMCLGATVNMAGGQPVSMANIRDVKALCARYGVSVMLDATRAVENAWFIKQREAGYVDKSVKAILKEFCSHSDGCTMSAKKDPLANIGGWLSLNDDALAEKAREMVVVYEGLHTYGGMAGRDMEAVARGIEESVVDDHMASRVGQVEYLATLLSDAGVPIVQPTGGHAVYLDARRFYPDVPQTAYPAQMLSAELYLQSGVRSMERGIVSAGRDKNGKEYTPKLELVRLTIPRRVYTQAHMDVIAEAVEACYLAKDKPKGMKMAYEPKSLRFFQARFEMIR